MNNRSRCSELGDTWPYSSGFMITFARWEEKVNTYRPIDGKTVEQLFEHGIKLAPPS